MNTLCESSLAQHKQLIAYLLCSSNAFVQDVLYQRTKNLDSIPFLGHIFQDAPLHSTRTLTYEIDDALNESRMLLMAFWTSDYSHMRFSQNAMQSNICFAAKR